TCGGAGLLHGLARTKFGPLFSAIGSRRASLVVLDTLRRSVQLPPHASAHSLGNAIIFIWGPNFKVLPAPQRRLGGKHRGGPNSLRSTCGGAGLLHGLARTKFGPLFSA